MFLACSLVNFSESRGYGRIGSNWRPRCYTTPSKMSESSPRMFRFGFFEVDTRSGELSRQDAKINLQEQPFQVLVLLLERPGEVVTRDELSKSLWPQNTFVDFERGLNKAINKLRAALRDHAEKPCFIETLPQRGYRFIAPVAMPAEKVVSRSHGVRAKIILASCLVVAIGLLVTLSQS